MSQEKTIAVVGYIIPILFFIPLLDKKTASPAALFHANQHLLLLIFWVVAQIVLPLIPIIGWLLMPIFFVFGLVLVIMGVVNASNDRQKPLPVIGQFNLLK